MREKAGENAEVHGGHPLCDSGIHPSSGSAAGASRFLTGLVTCFATHDGIPAVARASSSRYALGGIPTSSVKRVLKVPSDEQPTVKQTSVTLRSP